MARLGLCRNTVPVPTTARRSDFHSELLPHQQYLGQLCAGLESLPTLSLPAAPKRAVLRWRRPSRRAPGVSVLPFGPQICLKTAQSPDLAPAPVWGEVGAVCTPRDSVLTGIKCLFAVSRSLRASRAGAAAGDHSSPAPWGVGCHTPLASPLTSLSWDVPATSGTPGASADRDPGDARRRGQAVP